MSRIPMHSFLLIGTDHQALEKHAAALVASHKIDIFDTTLLIPEKSIGIEDIRNLQKKLLLTPLKSKEKAAIIHHADTMTLDAQNAFLKTLEEPPAHTILLLLGTNKEAFLPTVLSRCSITYIHNAASINSSTKECATFFQNIVHASVSERMKQAQTLVKTKEQVIAWLTDTQLGLRQDLLKSNDYETARILTKLHKAYKVLKTTNASNRMVLEHLFLSL